jgi:hypothetical protein
VDGDRRERSHGTNDVSATGRKAEEERARRGRLGPHSACEGGIRGGQEVIT